MRRNGQRRRLTGVLAAGLLLAQIAGCSSCVDDAKKEEPPATGGKVIGERTSAITDKRPSRVVADAATDAP